MMLKTLLLIASTLSLSNIDSVESQETLCSAQPNKQIARLTFDPGLLESDPYFVMEIEKITSSDTYSGPSMLLTEQNSTSVNDFYVSSLSNESDVPFVAALAMYNDPDLNPSSGGTILLGFENVYFSNVHFMADHTVAESLVDVLSGPSSSEEQETICFINENSCVSFIM